MPGPGGDGRGPVIERMDPSRAFEDTDRMERLKRYLREVPVLHARMENLLDRMQEALRDFEETTARIKDLVKESGE